MSPQRYFGLSGPAAMLAVVLAIFPLAGYCAAAGKAEFVIGRVTAVAADGSQRPLAKGAEINAGDAIHTAAGARAQIRFTDGGFVSLQPDSQFRVDEYHYENKTDGTEKGFFSLLKGGLRAITGLIGHVNRDNYKVATPVATIGIRGTGFSAVLNEHLTVSVADGIISLTNKGGTLILSQGQSAFVADMNTIPVLTFEKPATPPAGESGSAMPPPKPEQYVTGDLPTGQAIGLNVLTGVAAVGAGGGLGLGLLVDFPGIVAFTTAGTEVAYITSTGVLVDFAAATLDTSINNGIPASGYDGTVAWGRFYGPITAGLQSVNLTAYQGVHTVVGIPTAAMPTSGKATYVLLGATQPTLDGGPVWAPGMVTGGDMIVTFGAPPQVNGTLSFTMQNDNFTLKFSGPVNGATFAITNMADMVNGVNIGNVVNVVNGASALSNSFCNAGCAATVNGFLAGANAARAGISYAINGGSLPGVIHGAAAFKQTSLVP